MIKKRNEPKNLARLLRKRGVIVDRTPQSEQYFNITFLPTELVAGKNVIKIQGTRNLVKTTEVQFEIFDSNGTPIFYEVLNYLAADGSRAIVVYIYPETASGRATLYIGGRALANAETGEALPVSTDPASPDYFKEPNVLWVGNIIVNPTKENTSEIIYLATPKVTIKELVQTFKVPDTRTTPLKVSVSSSNNTISANASNLVPAASTGLSTSAGYTPPTTLNIVKEGQFKPTVVGSPSVTLTVDTVLNSTRTTGTSGDIIRLDNKDLLSRVYTSQPFFKRDMQGGTLSITVDTSSILPKDNITVLGQLINGEYTLSNVYSTTVVDVINDTTAVVSDTFRYYYQVPTKTRIGTNKQTTQAAVGFSKATNFTASFIQRVSSVAETESSQSYADIYISNLEAASGDVYKIQTFYKPYGTLGNFTDAGFTVIENTSLMNDTGSLVADALMGQKEQPKGDFTSQDVINSYWELTNVNITGTTLPAITSSANRLIDGMTITTGSGINIKDVDANSSNASATYVTLKDNLNVSANTEYKLTFKTTGVNSSTYKTSQFPNATIDIYISGSVGIDALVNETITDRKSNARSRKQLGNKVLGVYLGSFDTQGTYLDNVYEFKTLADGFVKPLFVVRSGEWTLADVDIIAEKQSGFTPNYTNFKVRIPSVYLNTEMIFNFKYFDSANNPAPVESTVTGVIFKGNNFYIAGNNNLLTGSVYIGNTIGSGIELAGVSSGYLRSIGYEGYTSASLGKAPGGFLIWSGSNKLNIGTDNYQGVGLELVGANDNSHLIFSTFGAGKLDIKAESFFIGSQNTQYISGSNGQIEISSSIFFLDPATNTLIIGASASILAPVAAEQIFTPALINGSPSNVTNASSSITNLGFAKFVSASIGGFDISTTQIKGGNLILDRQGIVQTADYLKNFRGFKITAEDNGVAEFENIKIRGTLQTTVFEKESVNAVGGQLYVANSTTISGSASPSQSFFLVKNVSGFEPGEIITAKKITNFGFNTEYLRVHSASRINPLSETDLSGYLYVTRSYGSGSAGSSGSIGDFANASQSYEEGQVIVSTGRVGTGFIRINANPVDTSTPYIDIVERTGSGIYDVQLKARLGDLSGLAGTSYVFNSNTPGFGLATDNVFLQGGIIANFGNIGGFNITKDAITGSGFFLSGSATGNEFFISSSKFNVKANGDISASNAQVRGDINADTGRFKNVRIIGKPAVPNAFTDRLVTTPYAVLETWITGSNDMSAVVSVGTRNYPNYNSSWRNGTLHWTISAPDSSSLDVHGLSSSKIRIYKDYTQFEDYVAVAANGRPMQQPATFRIWSDVAGTWEDYNEGAKLYETSPFLFFSSSMAVVSQSVYTYTPTTTQYVVKFDRPRGGSYGVIPQSFPFTSYYVFSGSFDEVNQAVPYDILETETLDFSNLVQQNSLVGLNLQFASRIVDNIDSFGSITYTDGAYSTYDGPLTTDGTATNGNGTYSPEIVVEIVSASNTVFQQTFPALLDATNQFYDYGKTDWFVVNIPLGTILRREAVEGSSNQEIVTSPFFKIRLKFRVKDVQYYANDGGGLTGAPPRRYSIGRYNGWAISELRLVQSPDAPVIKTNTVEFDFNSIQTGQYGLQVQGVFYPSKDNFYSLGNATNRWSVLYAGLGTINTSDRNKKTDIRTSDLGLSFINKLEPVSYRWKDAHLSNTLHYGLIAQDVNSTLTDCGVDSCFMTQDGTSIAYTELISPMIKAIQELTEKVTRLEMQISSSKQ